MAFGCPPSSSCSTLQNGCLDTLNSKICPLFQILDTEPGWHNNSGGADRGGGVEGGGMQYY